MRIYAEKIFVVESLSFKLFLVGPPGRILPGGTTLESLKGAESTTKSNWNKSEIIVDITLNIDCDCATIKKQRKTFWPMFTLQVV